MNPYQNIANMPKLLSDNNIVLVILTILIVLIIQYHIL